MSNKLTITVALAAGLAGGVLTRYIAPPPVFAQAPAVQAPANDIRARGFTLVNQADNIVGTFTVDKGGVVLRDANGRIVWGPGRAILSPMTER